MSSSNLSQHKVDHLFLLVGENPLPNYVAAKLLVRENGITYLVHSTRTKPEYDNLVNVLKTEGIKTQPVPLGQSEADGNEIQNQINKVLQPKKQPISGRVGLNYTGGTKAMAVHAYQAIQSFDSPSEESKVFSYLDSRSLKLFVDGHRPEPVGLAVQPPPSLDTLLQLHNLSWDKNNPPIKRPQMQNAASEFAKEFMKSPDPGQDSRISRGWNRWCYLAFQNAKYSEGNQKGFWKDEAELEKLPDLDIEIKTAQNEIVRVPEEMRAILRSSLEILAGTKVRVAELKKNFVDQNLELQYAYHWLSGGWLEDYVMWQIERIAHSKPNWLIHEYSTSLHIKDPEFSWKKNDQFEFDVVFLRGYQLFAISCTTISEYKTCKQKLFEAQLRARQLGGDEARIALVCCYDGRTKNLRKELSLVIGNQKEEDKYDTRIEVFGRSDLHPEKFYKKLEHWIFKNI